MNVERLRSILGVWAPMAIGILVIVTSLDFYFTAELGPDRLGGDPEPWRLICSVGALFVGCVMILSTLGRYRKSKAARRENPSGEDASKVPASPNGERDHKGDSDEQRS